MTLNPDCCTTILFHLPCNVKHLNNTVHGILLLKVDDLTFDKSICVSQQQHIMAFLSYQPLSDFSMSSSNLLYFFSICYNYLSVLSYAQLCSSWGEGGVSDLCVFICMDIFTVYIYVKNFAFCKH